MRVCSCQHSTCTRTVTFDRPTGVLSFQRLHMASLRRCTRTKGCLVWNREPDRNRGPCLATHPAASSCMPKLQPSRIILCLGIHLVSCPGDRESFLALLCAAYSNGVPADASVLGFRRRHPSQGSARRLVVGWLYSAEQFRFRSPIPRSSCGLPSPWPCALRSTLKLKETRK